MNIACLFERNGRRAGDRPAVASGGSVIATHAELAARAAKMATWLRGRHGLEPGDRIAVVLTNRPEYVEVLLACWWAGCAAVPLNAKLHPSELAYAIEHSQAGLVIGESGLMDGLEHNAPVLLTDSAEYAQSTRDDALALESRGSNDLAWLFYTSGTTGKPKGAMITHGNLRAMVYSYFIDIDQISPDDAILHAAPMSHGSGLYMLPHAAVGAVQVMPESRGFDPADDHGSHRDLARHDALRGTHHGQAPHRFRQPQRRRPQLA